MNILGLNFSLDSAAVLWRDGRLFASLQERFDRIKHSAFFPSQAAASCLQLGGVSWDDLDAVAVSWNPGIHLRQPNRLRETIYRDQRELLELIPAQLLRACSHAKPSSSTRLQIGNGSFDVHFFDHHLCHAAGAFYASGFPEAAVLTADGYGEEASTMIAMGDGEGIHKLASVNFPHSIGSVYAAVTEFLGFRPNSGEGKVMALAGMGRPDMYRKQFDALFTTADEGFEVDLSFFGYYHRGTHRYSEKFVKVFGQPRKPDEPLTDRDKNLAAALQNAVERVLLHLANVAHRKTGKTKLCLAGGVALNAVAMGRIERESPFNEIFVLPPAHDGGGPLGAVFLLARTLGAKRLLTSEYTDRYGPSCEDEKIRRTLEQYGLRFDHCDSPPDRAAEMIAAGKVIGWMQGAMEYGPRALGMRSILADVRNAEIRDVVNSKVKFRESFRPFAPVALLESIGEYFIDARPTPFMNKVVHVRKEAADSIPAVVHVDGSVRLQTVSRSQDPLLTELIAGYRDRTGIPMVLNTSLNKRGQPIVASMDDALQTFFTSGMDGLFLGRFLLEK